MKLFQSLFSFRREFIGAIPKHKGTVLKGRKKFVPPVTIKSKLSFTKKLRYEEEVMKYLSNSYITENQEMEFLHSKQLKKPEYWDDFLRREIELPLNQYYAADFLEKLDVSRSFEEED